MEKTPDEIDVAELYNTILQLGTVQEILDFHCWSLAGGKHLMTCHIRSKFRKEVVQDINRICNSPEYGIYHTTI